MRSIQNVIKTNEVYSTYLQYLNQGDRFGLVQIKMQNDIAWCLGDNLNMPCSSTIWKLIKLVCFGFVIFQTCLNIKHQFFSGNTISTIAVSNLEQIDFPFFLSIFVKPGFDRKKLRRAILRISKSR